MAEVATLSVLLQARDQLSGPLGRMQGTLDNVAAKARKMGLAMTVMGGAITGTFALAVKSSLEQQVGINQLDQALRNVGRSYDAEKDSIEAVIAAQQRKTNFGDEEQRQVLTRLVGVLGDEKKALEALPVVLDAAAFSGKSATTVSETLSKFLAGLANTSDSTGIAVDKLATFEERLAAVMKVAGGQAAAAADPFTQLKNQMADLLQIVGDKLLPLVTQAAVVLGDLVPKIQAWAEAHPQLIKFLVIAAAALGAILLVIGPLLIILPSLVAGIGFISVAFGALSIAMGPITLIVLAIAAAIAAGILIWRNWETIVEFGRKGLNAFTRTLGDVLVFLGLVNKDTVESKGVFAALREELEKTFSFSGFVEAAKQDWEDLKKDFNTVKVEIEKGIDAVVNFLAPVFDPVMSFLFAPDGTVRSLVIPAVVNFSVGAFDAVMKFFFSPDGTVRSLVIPAVVNFSVGAFDAVMSFFFSPDGTVRSLVIPAVVKFSVGLFSAVMSFLFNPDGTVRSLIFPAVLNFFTADVPAFIAGFFDGNGNAVTRFISAIVVFTKGPVATFIAGFFDGNGNAVTRFVSARVQWFTGFISSFISKFFDFLGNPLNNRVVTVILNFVAGAITGLFSFAKSIANSIIDILNTQLDKTFLSFIDIPRFVKGGIAPGGLALVGERGPELVNLPGGSRVIPNSQIGGVGGNTLIVHYHQNAPVYGILNFRREIEQVVRDAAGAGKFHGVLQTL